MIKTERMDTKEWTHMGLKCRATKHGSLGHYCGYVTVPEGHIAHGKGYGSLDIDVHGGLTFGKGVEGGTEFGFDCAHLGDYNPGSDITKDYWTRAPRDEDERTAWETLRNERIQKLTDRKAKAMARKSGGYYWSLADVVKQTNKMARQFASMKEWKCPTCGTDFGKR